MNKKQLKIPTSTDNLPYIAYLPSTFLQANSSSYTLALLFPFEFFFSSKILTLLKQGFTQKTGKRANEKLDMILILDVDQNVDVETGNLSFNSISDQNESRPKPCIYDNRDRGQFKKNVSRKAAVYLHKKVSQTCIKTCILIKHLWDMCKISNLFNKIFQLRKFQHRQ